MIHVQKIWQAICRNSGKVTVVVILLAVSSVAFVYLSSTSDLNRQSHAVAVQLSKRIGVPYPEAFKVVKSTLVESQNLPDQGGFFERIWYGSPRNRYLENTIETKLRRAGFSGFWLGSEVRTSVRSGLREAAAPQSK